MTHFAGHKTGFNPTGSNDCDPNPMGPPTTKFAGRGGVPEGPLKRYPGAVADISNGNRRLSKSHHGEGGGSGTSYSTHTAFGSRSESTGRSAKTYDTKGGKGSGRNKR